MKLADHTDKIRRLIDQAFRNRLGRMGISEKSLVPIENIPYEYHEDRKRIETIFDTLIEETNHKRNEAYEKLVEEFTFTLFNRLAALKVMEAHRLNPEIVTRQTMHGGRSFAHLAWLEENSEQRSAEQEGLVKFLEDELQKLSGEINLFSLDYPYHLLPTAIELNQIIEAFNAVEADKDVEDNIWQSDDVMGWLYESYNNYKKIAHKESKAKTEYNKVTIQSQVYTPRWVVKFLVDNSLGKLYLEMFPHSAIKDKYQIANAPTEQTRTPKDLTEVKLIDPACGSANFLLYGFDLFYDLYLDQIENYGADYDERKIPELILKHNLHGIDLDDRAVQIAQLGLYIKAKRKKRTFKVEYLNIVSSDFFLDEFEKAKIVFESDHPLDENTERIVSDIWSDLQKSLKFGSLLRIEEKFLSEIEQLIKEAKKFTLSVMYVEKISDYYKFRGNFFQNLRIAVAEHSQKFGMSFLTVKTSDAITFLDLLTQKYDVAVANPPYTDSSDFGAQLKSFIEANYKKPYKFNSNLYAAFIKRCCELTNENGYVALIHPHTFMFIKTFEDVRKFIIEKTHIDLFVNYGLDRANLFDTSVRLDAAFYVLAKSPKHTKSVYFHIGDAFQERNKKQIVLSALNDLVEKKDNKIIIFVDQSKLKIIEGYPFIYWISDGFRNKFKGISMGNAGDVRTGISTGDNERFTRFWWECFFKSNALSESEKWKIFIKGGKYNKWFGNNWLVINWANSGEAIKKFPKSTVRNESYYFKEGVSTLKATAKGGDFRISPENSIFADGAPSVFFKSNIDNLTALSFLNSKTAYYILSCLNPTVNTQVGDLERIPFIEPPHNIKKVLHTLGLKNVEIKKELNRYQLIEADFVNNPLVEIQQSSLQPRLFEYLNYENAQLAFVLINEAIINQLIFEVYELSETDKIQVIEKTGKPIGSFPLLKEAKDLFLQSPDLLQQTREYVDFLPEQDFEDAEIKTITDEFPSLYRSNNDLEEFCIRHQVNPINVWYWFKQSHVIPAGRAHEIALEFLADVTRTVLMEDEDGIVPLVGLPGEAALLDRLEQKCLSLGLSSAQFAQLDGLLGRPVKEYLEHHFFSKLSDHLNLFMYLPKTPFIWHLSSGEHHGFTAYIIIYKWTRDSLYKLKSTYITRREEALNYRLSQLAQAETAQAQTEKETIRLQLQEINDFTRKVDELIAEGYDPKLDDGVGKNIAPLQKKGMLRADVLNAKQLEKYLNADW